VAVSCPLKITFAASVEHGRREDPRPTARGAPVRICMCTSIHVFDWSQTSEPKHKNGRQRATKPVKCIEHFTYEEIELDICMAVRKDALTGLLVDCFKRNSTPKCWHSCIGADGAGTDV